MPTDQRQLDAPLLAAELHYFRMPRSDWELLLVRMRQLGASVISTYVPWSWHAPSPGTCDLVGTTDPRRDLVAFVRLCARLGLRVILKPGPFVDAELLGGGIPPWLLARHPEVAALRPDGTPWRHGDSGVARPCLLHPAFLRYARSWLDAFSAALVDLQAPSGPIIALQVDNEIPGDGMLPGDAGLDPRFRCDYNSYVVNELWPSWLLARFAPGDKLRRSALRRLNASWQTSYADLAKATLPRTWAAPTTVGELRRYADLSRFTDVYHTNALATLASCLREAGWRVPLFHDLLAAPWEGGTLVADAPGLAAACGWLAQNVYPEAVEHPFVGAADRRYSFAEYVHYAHWRTGLLRSLSPRHPAFVAEISAAHDFFFAAPFLGGCDGTTVYVGAQSADEPPVVAAYTRWGMEAPVRPDGSVRPRLWNAKGPLTLLDAAGGDFVRSRIPADIAIGYSREPEQFGIWLANGTGERTFAADPHTLALPGIDLAGSDHGAQGQRLAQQLVAAGAAFHVVDLDVTPAEELGRYPLLLVPATPVLRRATQEKLASLERLFVVGPTSLSYDEDLAPCDLLAHEQLVHLPADVSGSELEALAAKMGGHGRYGWADQPDIDVLVRHSAAEVAHPLVYLWVANRRTQPYSGVVAYRAPDGSIEHVNLTIGPLRVGLLILQGGEVLGASCGGDVSEGSWLVRGLQTSIVWSGGPAVVAPYDLHEADEPSVLFVSSPSSGRLNLRRPSLWEGLAAYRLLFSGTLLPAEYATENSHLTLPYIAEDELGQTDGYILCPPDAPLPPRLRAYLDTLLHTRASLLERSAAALKGLDGGPLAETSVLTATAATLERLTWQQGTADAYREAVAAADSAVAPAAALLARRLTVLRVERASGGDPADSQRDVEALEQALGLLARADLDSG